MSFMKSRLFVSILFSACTLASIAKAAETTPLSIPGSEPFVFLKSLDLLAKPAGSKK